MDVCISAAKAAMGSHVILGHHYQRSEAIKFADSARRLSGRSTLRVSTTPIS
jgi:hypothetical protein